MADGVDVGDAQAVGHDGGGGRSAPAGTGSLPDDLIHDQKIMGIAFVANDGQFMFDAGGDGLRGRSVAPPRPFIDLFAKAGEGFAIRELPEVGKNGVFEVPCRSALPGDAMGVGHGLGDMGKVRRKHLRGHQPMGGGGAGIGRQP